MDAPKLENKEKAQESIVTKVNKILTDFYKVSNITTAQDKQKRIDANLKKRFEKKYDDGLLKSSVDLSSLREKNAIRFMLDDVAKIASDESKKINATKPGAGGKVEKATAADINRKLDYLTILNSINELLSTDFED